MAEAVVEIGAPSDEAWARGLRCPCVLGYADRRSVRAGEPITLFVSSAGDAEYDAQLVRLVAPDIGPVGPRFRADPVDAPINGRHGGREQAIVPGSCAHVTGPLPVTTGVRLVLLVQPTLVGDAPATIAEITGPHARLVLTLDSSGLRATVDDGAPVTVSVAPLAARAWTDVEVGADAVDGRVWIATDPRPTPGVLSPPPAAAEAAWSPRSGAGFAGASLTLAASPDDDGRHRPETCFTGKVEGPRLYDTASDVDEPMARWDFSRDVTTERIADSGPHGLHGTLRNLPTRGTRGAAWTGDVLSWVADPPAYAAIHFHDDDVGDAGWEPSLTLDVPADLISGCYAVRLSPADDSTPEFWVPFVVRPAAGAPTRSIAFVVPTTTYGAYANMHLRVTAQFNELAHGRLTVLDSTDLLLLERPELGKSTYDTHRDGSPVVYSSMNRPVTNFRPTGRMYKFCLDLMIVDWLEALGFEVDVVTDDDLHVEGVDALVPYRVAITGSHPEYLTRAQFDAIEQFTDAGGRLMYLGGNGFYSAAEIPAHRLDVTEVRRPGQDNLWRVNHAEGVFSTSGRPGGLWRNIGRPENALIGVGFITQGFDACASYRRSDASADERVAWIFEGLDGDVIGDFGILQGGAAGYEIDRHDVSKGSPPHSVVVASSSGHSNLYDLMVPSILDTLPDPTRTQDPIRADMVFFETGGGGAVFSVGSIAWAGSLSHDGYRNSVSTVTANVLRRFDDPTPFTVPGRDAVPA